MQIKLQKKYVQISIPHSVVPQIRQYTRRALRLGDTYQFFAGDSDTSIFCRSIGHDDFLYQGIKLM